MLPVCSWVQGNQRPESNAGMQVLFSAACQLEQEEALAKLEAEWRRMCHVVQQRIETSGDSARSGSGLASDMCTSKGIDRFPVLLKLALERRKYV